ncbi:alpha/beta fold hydrolase [Legionella jordanis]|uniref:PHA synthase n=1 Tax=Legionella jordanis TaxID=456 RepID=A0A0W0V923_9GAMM|nr:alpha/beta fold hydrolase [Legionella jordanis]KTD16629.1 PHA synthase [Legionella jordanis]RMX03834.1 alpha/beta fold hydrolase [Legionella jordanis]VEH11907.1 PHA synthase [Legionella jordanis]
MQWMDLTRRNIGKWIGQFGLDPQETPYQIIADLPGARIRKYHSRVSDAGLNLLIIPAPFKRPYIWDLIPRVSVVQQLLSIGLKLYLLEWTIPTEREENYGLLEYVHYLPLEAMEVIEADSGRTEPRILAGHSLGGTFAAIFATLFPELVSELILVDSPLVFGKHGGPIAKAAAAIPDLEMIRPLTSPSVSGSFINWLSLNASPEVFQMQRVMDWVASCLDPLALEIHSKVGRWTYDELPLPWPLFKETVEQLFRQDRFLKGTLKIGKGQTGISHLHTATLAIVNPPGLIVPPDSTIQGLHVAHNASAEILTYMSDNGPMFQHLGPLVSPIAHQQLWPKILNWIKKRHPESYRNLYD